MGKNIWYEFGYRSPASLILSRGIGSRHYCTLNTAKALSSGSFTEIRLNSADSKEAVWLFLNSALGWMLIELSGRSAMGGGMLKVDPTDIRKMKVLNPKNVKKSLLPELKSMLGRQVGTVEEESHSEDHLLIDKYIMGDILGLTTQEQDEIRRSVIELVHNRHARADSVRNGKKARNGIDFDKLSEDTCKRTEATQLILFVKDKVLTLPLARVQLPAYKGKVMLENTLLGWRLKTGTSIIECKSEMEGRFLSIFMEMRCESAPVPKSPHLKLTMVKELESLFLTVTEVLEETNSSILQRRLRDRFTRIFWAHMCEIIMGNN